MSEDEAKLYGIAIGCSLWMGLGLGLWLLILLDGAGVI